MRSNLALLAALSCGALAGADDVPAWLKDAAAATLPAFDRKVTKVVLFNEEATVVADTGRLTQTTRTAIRFLTGVGAEHMFVERYDTASSKVKEFRAWLIPANGKVKKYGKDEILDLACAENDVYNDCRRRVVSARRDADAGVVFAFESVVERQLFANQLMFSFQDSSPVRLARFSVTAPSGWEVKSASFNGAPAEPPPAGGTYTWQMENLPAIEAETASPSALTLAPWTGVNLIGRQRLPLSWPAAAKMLVDLNEGVAEPNESIAAKAKALTEGAATELDKIRAIGRFVQQINYVSVQVDIAKGGGYRPHAAPQVYQHLYGDCKDKANLMRAMLKAVGITAFPVAIYAGDRTHVLREWPSLGTFNHAISAIRVGPDTHASAVLDHPRMGRLLFFDSTDPYTPAGFVPDHEQASFALVGMADAGDLVQVPAAPAVAEARERTVEAILGADGSLSGSFVDKRSGEALPEALAQYRGRSKTDFVKSIERWIGRSVPGGAASDVQASDEAGAFVLKARFQSARYAQAPQARMMIFRAAPLRHTDSLVLSEKTRKHPIEVDADALLETTRITLPAGFKVDELPDAVKVESPFGKFEASWAVDGGVVVFRRRLEIQAQSVPAAKYAELRKFLDSAAAAPETPLVLVK